MDFETTSLSGSQLFQQLKSTLAQYAPDYAEEARQYEQAKDSLPDSTYPDALEAQFAAKSALSFRMEQLGLLDRNLLYKTAKE